MDDREIEWQLTEAQIQANAVLMCYRLVKEQVGQCEDYAEDVSDQHRLCDGLYQSIHSLLWHHHQLSRVFWPAKCCGETGLELCHKAMVLRAELDLPDVQHPLRNETLWRHGAELYRVVHEQTDPRYQMHHVASENKVITWMDNDAMFCLYEPATERFMLHGDEFFLVSLCELASELHLMIQQRLDHLRRFSVHSSHPHSSAAPGWGHRA
ncbi:hypothetical protein [Rheinheimera sp.]|uniref:hypothetical protein n=1 Tax=Rheinheimera sp. TaxID=1869214 RepID=UPI00307D4BD4